MELFAAQDEAYRRKVLPAGPMRVAIEAGVRMGWDRWLLGERGRDTKADFVGMSSFGASAPYDRLYKEFGITAEAVADAGSEADASTRRSGDLSSARVLIVDDNATNRVVAQALCEMFGCTSETAEDGVEALEAVQQRRFDLILMDIKMPRMDGVQATQAIRKLTGPGSQTPIIALTANADPEDVRSYIEAGMNDVVEKPIKAERMLQALQSALEGVDAASAAA